MTIKLLELTSVGDVSCLLRVSFNDISRIKTEDESIQSIIDLINLILFIKNPTKTDERQKIPVKLYLNKGSIYVNAIPIYQFPIKN